MLELIKTLAAEKTLIISQPQPDATWTRCATTPRVLSKGQLIFHGSLQDLKGRIRKNHYELDLEGDQKAITKAVAALRGLKDFKQVLLRQRRLEVKLGDETPNAALLAQLFQVLRRQQGDARHASAASACRPSRRTWTWWRRKRAAASPGCTRTRKRRDGERPA